MPNILMVYGSTYGQTGKIVRRLADRLLTDGHRVTVWKGDVIPAGALPDGTDLVLVAGSVLYGKYQPYLADFVRAQRAALARIPSVFVSVCGAAAHATPEGAASAERYLQRFLRRTDWRPTITRSFAGGLAFTRYGLVTRWIMKLISARTGGPTDTSRDWEFTNWANVDRFALELESLLPQPAAAH